MNKVMNTEEENVLTMTAHAALCRRRDGLVRRRTFHGDNSRDVENAVKFTMDRSIQVGNPRRLFENEYMRKKTTLQGLLVATLLVSTASNLRELLHTDRQPTFYSMIFLLTCVSLSLQVLAATLILSIAVCERKMNQDLTIFRTMNDVTIFLVFVVLLISIFLSSLGPFDRPATPTSTINTKITRQFK